MSKATINTPIFTTSTFTIPPPNTPLLALSGVDLSRDRSPVAFARTLCRSDQFQFSFRLVRDGV